MAQASVAESSVGLPPVVRECTMTTDKIIPFPAIDVASPVIKESDQTSFHEQVAKRFRLVPN
jgi:hypothetical protein